MDSVNSRSELFPNRAFTPPDSVFAMDDDHDPEFQARMPLRHHSPYVRLKARISTSRGRPIPEPSKSSNKRPRKKINETYEPVGTKGRRRTFTDESYSSDGYHRDRCSICWVFRRFGSFGINGYDNVRNAISSFVPRLQEGDCAWFFLEFRSFWINGRIVANYQRIKRKREQIECGS
ncbi:unnamed protein product [Porites evermanni]|uniref:Uncharacterized protein n=1 Tax=Porites evermanni TaxID=104178 RepID=A0ABN8SQI0_9CNID|nr:unnamed protein product [Porites evermanni]